MTAKPTFTEHPPSQTIAAAALATVITFALLWSVATLFQSRGEPLEQLAAAERACAHYSYQSEQQACITQWLAAAQPGTVAQK